MQFFPELLLRWYWEKRGEEEVCVLLGPGAWVCCLVHVQV